MTHHRQHGTGDDDDTLSRRDFLSYLAVASGSVVAGLMGLPVIGFLLGPLLRREALVWRDVGAVSNFAVGDTVAVSFLNAAPVTWAGVAARSAAYLRRLDETTFLAFSVNCTHLGCPVRWQKEAELFMCPCHGGVFYADGSVAAGPVRSPLEGYPVRVHEGRVQIRTEGIPLPD
jgi:menaquinol-cytochrome c reductase iron-sulfur subunit